MAAHLLQFTQEEMCTGIRFFLVSGGEDCRNSWRQLSRPKKSVRVGGVIEDWRNKDNG